MNCSDNLIELQGTAWQRQHEILYISVNFIQGHLEGGYIQHLVQTKPDISLHIGGHTLEIYKSRHSSFSPVSSFVANIIVACFEALESGTNIKRSARIKYYHYIGCMDLFKVMYKTLQDTCEEGFTILQASRMNISHQNLNSSFFGIFYSCILFVLKSFSCSNSIHKRTIVFSCDISFSKREPQNVQYLQVFLRP